MLLFHVWDIKPILTGRKTQNRWVWDRRQCVPGAVHRAQVGIAGAPFAHLRAIRVWKEQLDSISKSDAFAEGFDDPQSFVLFFQTTHDNCDSGEQVWAVEFELVGEPDAVLDAEVMVS